MSGPSDAFGAAKREAEPDALPDSVLKEIEDAGGKDMTEREKMVAGLPCK